MLAMLAIITANHKPGVPVNPALAYRHSAMLVPQADCSLFVPSATCGGKPAANKAGSVISPPPPAIASMKPPHSPATNSSVSCSGDSGVESLNAGICQPAAAGMGSCVGASSAKLSAPSASTSTLRDAAVWEMLLVHQK